MTRQNDPSEQPVAILGAGSIGVSFAALFLARGQTVRISDPDPERRNALKREIAGRLDSLLEHGLSTASSETGLSHLTVHGELASAVADVSLVIECAPEKLELKQTIFEELGRAAPPDSILASASSAMLASEIAGDMAHRGRCLLAHPVNPPHIIPIIEIAPAEFTLPDVTDAAMRRFEAAGFRPVQAGREINGLIFNRLQGAVLREAYCLVRDGVAAPQDIDAIVRDALALRWSVTGPFETVDLNTRGGIASHAEKMGPAYHRMGRERGQDDPWTAEMVARVEQWRREALPMEEWDDRVRWREQALLRLAAFRAGG